MYPPIYITFSKHKIRKIYNLRIILAIFPVLYFLCAALWLNNDIAVVIILVFGVAHSAVSYISFNVNH